MLIVKELNSKLIVESGLCLLKGDRVLLEVCNCFEGVPLEPNHQYSVLIYVDTSRDGEAQPVQLDLTHLPASCTDTPVGPNAQVELAPHRPQ